MFLFTVANQFLGDIAALRLYPPVPNNAKMAIKDTILPRGGGSNGDAPILIKKGDWVIYTVYAMHRRKDLFGEDADEFRPERWVKNDLTWVCFIPFILLIFRHNTYDAPLS